MAFAGCGRLAVLVMSGRSWWRLAAAPGWRMAVVRGFQMCNLSEWIVREAFLAYDRGDVAAMMGFVDPCLEWVCPDPGPADPQQRVRRGRGELEKALRQQADLGLRAELEEVIAAGDQVILVMRTPGVDEYRHRLGADRTYHVVTVRDGLIAGLHACRDRGEAHSLAGIG
jgi:ketosteroid isomerase-like protein